MLNKIQLNRTDLVNLIEESIKQTLSELDWKTYQNAANKRQNQADQGAYNDDTKSYRKYKDKASNLQQMANSTFNQKYGYNSKGNQITRSNDGNVKGYYQNDSNTFDDNYIYKNDKGQYVDKNHQKNLYNNTDPNQYMNYYNNGEQNLSTQFNGDNDAAHAMRNAGDENHNYQKGNYEYKNGQWILKQ